MDKGEYEMKLLIKKELKNRNIKNKKTKQMDKLFTDIALRFAKESHCESHKVCALAVKNNRIIATGINGTPKGSINCDDYFKAYHKSKKINIDYNDWIKTKEFRSLHHDWSNKNETHAEMSLVAECAKNGISLKDSTIYTTLKPCVYCSKLLSGLGIKEIIYINDYDKSDIVSEHLLNTCGITIRKYI